MKRLAITTLAAGLALTGLTGCYAERAIAPPIEPDSTATIDWPWGPQQVAAYATDPAATEHAQLLLTHEPGQPMTDDSLATTTAP